MTSRWRWLEPFFVGGDLAHEKLNSHSAPLDREQASILDLLRRRVMSDSLNYALMVLQQRAYARALCEFERQQLSRHRLPISSAVLTNLTCRFEIWDQRWASVQRALGAGHRPALRVARALFLQRMLESAPARLAGWSDNCPLSQMPMSHLFEWVAYDLERMELAELEDAMGAEEAALYASALDQLS